MNKQQRSGLVAIIFGLFFINYANPIGIDMVVCVILIAVGFIAFIYD